MGKYTNDKYRLPLIGGNINTRDGENCRKDQKKIKLIYISLI